MMCWKAWRRKEFKPCPVGGFIVVGTHLGRHSLGCMTRTGSICALAQEFEDTTEFSTMNFIGEVFKDKDYKGGHGGLLESEQEDTCGGVEGVEELIGV